MYSSSRSTTAGLLLAATFIAVVTATAIALRPKRQKPELHSPLARTAWLAGLILLAAGFVAALETSSWTYYPGTDVEAQDVGGVRLELVYPFLLPAMLMLVWRTIVDRWTGRPPRSRTALLWAAMAVLLLLVFVLQMRRLMLTTLLFSALALVQNERSWSAFLSSARRKLAVALVVIFELFAISVGSNIWRTAAMEYSQTSVSLSNRLRLTAGSSDVATDDRLSDRVTYLGLNSAAVEYGDTIGDKLTVLDIATSSVVYALPGTLFPWKYGPDGASRLATCESAFQAIGQHDDLPCTPEAEAFLAGGPIAVIIVAMLWGAFFAWLSLLLCRPGFSSNLVALVGFVPMSLVEASALPMAQSLRLMGIVGAVVWGGPAVFRALRRRGHTKGIFAPDSR
jgi:hypothetical protein